MMSDYIIEDIQLKILKQLPVRTLLRFRCVCKRWKQTIDSEQFIKDHLALQKRFMIVEYKHNEYLIVNPCKLPSLDILIIPTSERLHLVNTLHGTICLYNRIQYNFMLWNPYMHRVVTVKKGPSFEWERYDKGEYLIGPCCAFWIDPSTKHFKIIMFLLVDDYQEKNNVYWLYSSVLGDWKEFPFNDELDFYYTMGVVPAVVMNGIGYWIAYYDDYEDDDGERKVGAVVLSFDFVREKFLEPIFVFDVSGSWDLPILCDSDGTLSLVFMDIDRSCNIFVKKEDIWVHVHHHFPVCETVCLVMVEEDEENEKKNMTVLATRSDKLLMFYNDDPEIVIASCDPLMNEIKDSNIVVANGLVESLLFPEV